jgi:small subunit ribosomal protein S19e
MTTPFDVPAKEFIDVVAKKLQKDKSVSIPEQNKHVRTGVHKESTPENNDWWFIRCASILRKVYMKDKIGVEQLKAEYGGKRDRGSKPYKARSGSGTIVRRALQQLEKAGYVSVIKGQGRAITPKGRSFMDNIANELKNKISTYYPGLEKY